MNAIPPSPPSSGRSPSTSDVLLSADQESSLVDIYLLLIRYRKLVTIISLAGAVCGILVAIFLPRTYAFTTTFEIGTIERDTAQPIESPDAVISKITNVYQPTLERQHGLDIGQPSYVLGLDVRNPRGTNLVVLSSKGTEDQEKEQLTLQGQITDNILKSHHQYAQLALNNLDLELEQAKHVAAALNDKAGTLKVRRTLLQQKRTMTTERLQQIDEELSHIEANRESAGKSLSGQDQVLTLMMLDLQVTRERDRRADLQREATINLTEEAERLTQEEADLARSQKDQEGRINLIQARIGHLLKSRLIGNPQRSQKPVGLGRITIVMIGILVGLIVGIALASLSNALAKRRSSPVHGVRSA